MHSIVKVVRRTQNKLVETYVEFVLKMNTNKLVEIYVDFVLKMNTNKSDMIHKHSSACEYLLSTSNKRCTIKLSKSSELKNITANGIGKINLFSYPMIFFSCLEHKLNFDTFVRKEDIS